MAKYLSKNRKKRDLGGDIGAGLTGVIGGALGTVPMVGGSLQQGVYGLGESVQGPLSDEEKSIRGYGQAAGAIGSAIATGGTTAGSAIGVGASGLSQGITNGNPGNKDMQRVGMGLDLAGTVASSVYSSKGGSGEPAESEAKFKMGGSLTKYNGPNHEQGGVNFGDIQTEGGETESNGIVNSKSYTFNKHMAKGLSMAGIDIGKHIGRTPAQASIIEDKRYPRENDVYTNNSLKREEEQGRGKFAIENASSLIGSMVNPDAQMAKYGGNIRKFGDGGTYLKNGREIKQSDSDWDFNEQNEWDNQSKNNLISEGGGTSFPYSDNKEGGYDGSNYNSKETDKSIGWMSSPKKGLNIKIPTIQNQSGYQGYVQANPNPNMTAYPDQGNGMLNPDYDSNSFNLRNNQDTVTPLVPKGYQKPGSPPEPDDEGTTSMRDLWDQGSSREKYESKDSRNLAGAAFNSLGDIYNIGRGLKGGDPVNYERVIPEMVNYEQSRNINRRDIKEGFKNMQNEIKSSGLGSGQALNLSFQNAGRRDRNISDSNAKSFENEINVNAGFKNSSRYANAQIQMQESIARQQEKDVASNQVQAGLAGVGQSLGQYGSDEKNDTSATNAISSKYPDWKLDKRTGMYKFNGQSKTAEQLLNS